MIKLLRIYQHFRFPAQLIHLINPDAFVLFYINKEFRRLWSKLVVDMQQEIYPPPASSIFHLELLNIK